MVEGSGFSIEGSSLRILVPLCFPRLVVFGLKNLRVQGSGYRSVVVRILRFSARFSAFVVLKLHVPILYIYIYYSICLGLKGCEQTLLFCLDPVPSVATGHDLDQTPKQTP